MVHQRIPSEQVHNAEILGEKLTFRNGSQASNRFLKAALTEKISTWDDKNLMKRGIVTESLINLYDKWGHGGFGMVLTGNFPVDPNHPEAAGNAIVARENESEKRDSQLKRLASTIKSQGSLALVQLTHAGRQTAKVINPTPFSASDVQLTTVMFGLEFAKPIPLTIEQIQTEVIDRFVYAAVKCYEAGFDGIQLHGAHGYLLSQFMSPTTNKRTDKYGGTPENRVRIVLEIYEAIRKAISDETFIIGLKMNSVEFQAGGLQSDDARIISELVDKVGFDFVELSGGTYEKIAFSHQRESTKAREAFFLEFTDKIRPVFKNTIVYVTGGFRTVNGMVEAVESGSTDGIGLGRPITDEPDLPNKILSGNIMSASDRKFDPNDFSLTLVASSIQMAQMSKTSVAQVGNNLTHGVADFSNPTEAENFIEKYSEFKEYLQKTTEEGNVALAVFDYSNITTK